MPQMKLTNRAVRKTIGSKASNCNGRQTAVMKVLDLGSPFLWASVYNPSTPVFFRSSRALRASRVGECDSGTSHQVPNIDAAKIKLNQRMYSQPECSVREPPMIGPRPGPRKAHMAIKNAGGPTCVAM